MIFITTAHGFIRGNIVGNTADSWTVQGQFVASGIGGECKLIVNKEAVTYIGHDFEQAIARCGFGLLGTQGPIS